VLVGEIEHALSWMGLGEFFMFLVDLVAVAGFSLAALSLRVALLVHLRVEKRPD
jgi:hypothetical protein